MKLWAGLSRLWTPTTGPSLHLPSAPTSRAIRFLTATAIVSASGASSARSAAELIEIARRPLASLVAGAARTSCQIVTIASATPVVSRSAFGGSLHHRTCACQCQAAGDELWCLAVFPTCIVPRG